MGHSSLRHLRRYRFLLHLDFGHFLSPGGSLFLYLLYPFVNQGSDSFQKFDARLVQVIKEGIGTKGPTLSTYLSIPGRFLVLMPGMHRMGISRKIDDEMIRIRLRELLGQLDPPKDMGFIIRFE